MQLKALHRSRFRQIPFRRFAQVDFSADFVLLRMVPGNPVATLLGEHADNETVERISSSLGLNKPLHVQFADYLLGALRGDASLPNEAR